MLGTYEEAGQSFESEILWKRPSLRVVRVGPAGSRWIEGFNGRAWEYDEGSGTITFTTGAAEAATRRGAEFDESLVDWQMKGHNVDLVGVSDLASGPANHVRVTLLDGWVKDYHIDPTTHLIAALGKAMPIHAVGEPVESVSSYEDYRPVAGVVYPFRQVERRVSDGSVMNSLQWHSIEPNVSLEDGEFDPPSPRD
jgi:hypothetical protein